MQQILFVLSSVPSLFFPQDPIVEMSAVRGAQYSYIVTLAQGDGENVLRLHCIEGAWRPGLNQPSSEDVFEVERGISFSISDIYSIRTREGLLDHYMSYIFLESNGIPVLKIVAWRDGGDCRIQRTWRATAEHGYWSTEMTPIPFGPIERPSEQETALVVTGGNASAGRIPWFVNLPATRLEDQVWSTGGNAFEGEIYRETIFGGLSHALGTMRDGSFYVIAVTFGPPQNAATRVGRSEATSGAGVSGPGGADHTDGAVVNVVTKSGTDKWELPGDHFFLTDRPTPPKGVLEEAGAIYTHYDENRDEVEVAFTLGGPLIKDRLWYWGAFAREGGDLAVTREREVKLSSDVDPFSGVWPTGDGTLVFNKLDAQQSESYDLVAFNTQGDEIKFGRARPLVTARRTGWDQKGPSDLYKVEETHVLSPNFYGAGSSSYFVGGSESTPDGELGEGWSDYFALTLVDSEGLSESCNDAGSPEGPAGQCLNGRNVVNVFFGDRAGSRSRGPASRLAGGTGSPIGVAQQHRLTDDTGYATFFDEDNIEVVYKLVDGCALNGHFWFFAGGLTDLPVDIVVADTLTGRVVVYSNPPGAFGPKADTLALPCEGDAQLSSRRASSRTPSVVFPGLEGAAAAAATELVVALDHLAALSRSDLGAGTGEPATVDLPSGGGACASGAETLCLNDDRFELTVDWRSRSGSSGTGKAGAITSDSGYFWFFSAGNVEIVVKVLRACGLNNRYWVFATGLTNVEATITVRDTVTGAVKTYTNPLGQLFLPIQDTSAFAC